MFVFCFVPKKKTEIESQYSQDLILKMLVDEPENRISSSDVVDYLEKLRNQTETS